MNHTYTPTSLLSTTMTPTITLTYTPILITPTQILTPEPTLTETQRKEFFTELLRDNAGCKLPCWWVITPGGSTWENARSLIYYTGFGFSSDLMPNGAIFHGTGYDWPDPLISSSIGFYDIDRIIEDIFIYTEGYCDQNLFRMLWQSYSPDQILAAYGQPTEVYVAVSQGVGGAGSGIILKYDEVFMLIYKNTPIDTVENGKSIFRICPSWQDITWKPELYIVIGSSTNSLSIEEFMNLVSSYPLEHFIPIQEAAETSLDEFYQRFSQGYGPACLDTPQDVWK